MTGQKREKGDYLSEKKIPHTSEPHEEEQKDCSRRKYRPTEHLSCVQWAIIS